MFHVPQSLLFDCFTLYFIVSRDQFFVRKIQIFNNFYHKNLHAILFLCTFAAVAKQSFRNFTISYQGLSMEDM